MPNNYNRSQYAIDKRNATLRDKRRQNVAVTNSGDGISVKRKERSESAKERREMLRVLSRKRQNQHESSVPSIEPPQKRKRGCVGHFGEGTSATTILTGNVDLDKLACTILNLKEIDQPSIDLMAKGQSFAKHPKLALAYFHLCSTDPNSHIFNDECLQGEHGTAVMKRLLKSIGGPINKEEARDCQEEALKQDPGVGRIGACASCNEYVFESEGNITTVHIKDLHKNFLLSEDQKRKAQSIPCFVLDNFVSVFRNGGQWYHLNPDLVPDGETVVLCKVCCDNPLQHPFSLANGHDYGRKKHFPCLNALELAAVIPVRPFNVDVLLKPNHSTGHSICFPSSGPVEMSKALPCLDSERRPQITFVGPAEKWRITSKKWKKLYDVDTNKLYEVLQLWKDLDNKHFDSVTVVRSAEHEERISKAAEAVWEEAVVTKDEDSSQEKKDEKEHEKKNIDASSDMFSLVHSAVLPNPLLVASGRNEGVDAFVELTEHKREEVKQKQYVYSCLTKLE